MKQKLWKHALLGAPLGLSLWVLFTLWGSWLRGTGEYTFVSAHLIRVYGTELNAVTAACLSAMVLGILWSCASLIFQETDWSLLKQTLIHVLVCTLPALLIAYAMQWMPHTPDGLMQYLLLFAGLYALNWACQYLHMKKRIRQFNAQLNHLNTPD